MGRNALMLAMMAIALGLSGGVTAEEDPVIHQARTAIADTMKDPSSVQFKDLQHHTRNSKEIVCGKLNAKNSYGAYVGFKEFMVIDAKTYLRESQTAQYFDVLWNNYCKPASPAS